MLIGGVFTRRENGCRLTSCLTSDAGRDMRYSIPTVSIIRLIYKELQIIRGIGKIVFEESALCRLFQS